MIDLSALTKALEAHAKVIRLVVVGAKGSTPRDIGTSMLICDEGHEGTIGGGRLELDAIKTARSLLDDNRTSHTDQMSLGPHLGQCCGGAVTLVFERFDAQVLAKPFQRQQPVMRARLKRVQPRCPRRFAATLSAHSPRGDRLR